MLVEQSPGSLTPSAKNARWQDEGRDLFGVWLAD
jgi:hypothetical protein